MVRAGFALIGVTLSAALVVTGAVPTQAEASRPEADVAPCQAAAASSESAAEMARRCGQSVEVLADRTEWDTVFAQPDGQTRLVASIAAVRTRQDGGWTGIDSTLVDSSEGVRVAAAVTPMVFSDGSDAMPLARIERDGQWLSMDVPFDLPEPQIDSSRLTYPQVLPGVDLIVTVNADATGFSEVLRIASAEAAMDPRLRELQMDVETSDELAVVASQGGFEARDASGSRVFWSPAPQMWDSSAPSAIGGSMPLSRSAQPSLLTLASAGESPVDRAVAPADGDAVAAMPVDLTSDGVALAPSAQMLESPDTVWPVYIDPAVSGSPNAWTAVLSSGSKTWLFSTDQGVGLCKTDQYMTCTPSSVASRLFWQFTGLGAVGAVAAEDITSATFSAYGQHTYNCTAQPVTLYWASDFDSSTGWPGPALLAALDTQNVMHKSTCSGNPPRWIGFNALGAAQAVANADADHLSLGLAAPETSNVYWKRYRYDATLSVTYNQAPNVPTALKLANPVASCGGAVNVRRPTLSAVMSDPDGDNVNGQFAVTSTSTGASWAVDLGTQASGATFTSQPPADLPDGAYTWTARTADGYRWGPLSAACAFTVDTVAPNQPTATAGPLGTVTVDKTQYSVVARYVENAASGGAGLLGQFVFGAGGSTDVATYRYSFDDTVLTSTVTASVGWVLWSPSTVGLHVLRVASVDRAGNTSAVRTYRFSVAFPGSTGTWTLDEGSGATSAADTSGAVPAHPLAVSGSTVWADGFLTEFGVSSSDRALSFDALGDSAATSGPVVATDATYTVLALVKLGSLSSTAAAVSQDGTFVSGFELGYRASDSGCPTGTGSCFAVWTYPDDSATPGAAQVAYSAVVPQDGVWYLLAAEHNATATTTRLSVCTIGTPDEPGDGEPIWGPTLTGQTAHWNATGALQLGHGRFASTSTDAWPGVIDRVQVTTSTAVDNTLERVCAGDYSS